MPDLRVLHALRRQLRRREAGPPPPFAGDVGMRCGSFAVVGDLQRTSLAELWRESNAEERERVVREIAARRPDFLVIAGDAVFCGSSRVDWEEFDTLAAPLRDAGVPVLPILGNHEYWVREVPALRNYFARFPGLGERRWYARTYGPLGLVFLDSNEAALGPPLWAAQAEWLSRSLSQFDADDSVRGVLVFSHHPPYTNSTRTPDERHVQRTFVPPFSAARKTLALVSGHVHSYERFVRNGKTFLVTGGGGGPRVRLARGERRRHADDAFEGPDLRLFHFLVFTPGDAGLHVEVEGLEKRGEAFAPLSAFTLSWSA